MAWPDSPLTTYLPNSLPAVKAFDLNAMQAEINHRVPASLVDEIVHRIPEIAFDPPRLHRADVGDERRDPAVDRGPRQRVEPVGIHRVQVRLDDPGQDELAGRVDHPPCRPAAAGRLDTLHEAVTDEDVGQPQRLAVDQDTATDLHVTRVLCHSGSKFS